jgi:AraC family transcriptional regulator
MGKDAYANGREDSAVQQPQIADKPELTVVGQERPFIHAQSPDANNLRVLGALWEEFGRKAGSIPGRRGHAMYGVIYERPRSERSHPDELQYIAGVAASSPVEVPAGMVARTIPATTFAIFLHKGPIQEIGRTVGEIYTQWLPASGYEHSRIADIELYDDRFCGGGPEAVMEYWISVRPR